MARARKMMNQTNVPDFVRLIDQLINGSYKTQREIAEELGYDKSNIITMFKQNLVRVPLDKVPRLAVALDQDPGDFLRLWMTHYMPEALEVIDANLGISITQREQIWLIQLRKLTDNCLPEWTSGMAEAIGAVVKPALAEAA